MSFEPLNVLFFVKLSALVNKHLGIQLSESHVGTGREEGPLSRALPQVYTVSAHGRPRTSDAVCGILALWYLGF